MTLTELELFKRDIAQICQSYGVLIRRQGERREHPKPESIYFYEIELHVKVNPNSSDVITEVRN